MKCMENRGSDDLARANRKVEEMTENEIELQNKIENLEKVSCNISNDKILVLFLLRCLIQCFKCRVSFR